MIALYVLHIAAGTVSLVSGFIALFGGKGTPLHRRAGLFFFVAMLVMCVAGGTIAATKNVAPRLNISAAVLTAYLVITSFGTIRPGRLTSGAVQRTLLTVAIGLAGVDAPLLARIVRERGAAGVGIGFPLLGFRY